MRTLIYQCWTGPIRTGVYASMENIRGYAGRIGAEYRFDHNPNMAGKLCDVAMYFEWLNPLLDPAFLEYDRVLVLDMDVFAVEGLTESIFEVAIEDVGICTEPFQPEHRATLTGSICGAEDERWVRAVKAEYGVDLPRINGRPKVYNAGVVLFSRQGIRKAMQRFVPFQAYIDAMRRAKLPRFYCVDQNYFHAMMVAHLEYTEMDNGWNSYMHYLGEPHRQPRPIHDERTKATKLVHVQLRGADDWSAEQLRKTVNAGL